MPRFSVDTDLCITCGECVNDCIAQCLELAPNPRIVPGREDACIECQHCLAVCPVGAISVLGRTPKDSIEFSGNMPTPDQMEVLIKGRRSVRRYKKDRVDRAVIDRLMDGLASAPTGVNNRGVLLTLVDDPAVMDRLRADVYRGLKAEVESGNLPPERARFASFLEPWENGTDILFRGAPHMLVATSPKDAPCPEADPFIALSYFELYARSMGLGTVWCGLGKYAIFDLVPGIAERLGIPDTHRPGYVMMFGKPAVKYYRTVNRGPANVNRVSW